jgi:hypothetical protein
MGAVLLPPDALRAHEFGHIAGDSQLAGEDPGDESRWWSAIRLQVLATGGAHPTVERLHRVQFPLPLDVLAEVGDVVEHGGGMCCGEDPVLPNVWLEMVDLDGYRSPSRYATARAVPGRG